MSADEPTRTFHEFDGDSDGKITGEEFARAMATRGETVTSGELESIFRHADSDGDGKISLAEFTEAWNR